MHLSVTASLQPQILPELDPKAKKLKVLRQKAQVLYSLLQMTFTVGDIGTGDVSLKEFKFDMLSKSVYGIGPRITVDRTTSPEVFLDDLKKYMSPFGEAVLYGTSWARNPNETDKNILTLLERLNEEYPNIKVKVLSQCKEAKASSLSLENILQFKNCNNPLLAAVTAQNTIQLEGGKGSIQSHTVLPQQKIEKAGAWVDKEIKSGRTPTEVKNVLKSELKSELKGPEAIQGIKNIAVQGLFAVALQDPEIMNSLKVKKEEWIVGQIPVALPDVIEALQEKIQKVEKTVEDAFMKTLDKKEVLDLLSEGQERKNDKGMDLQEVRAYFKKLRSNEKDKESQQILKSHFVEVSKAIDALGKSVPAITCLAMLEPFQEQYGRDFSLLTMKEDVKLFYLNGMPTGQDAKVTGAHGIAVKYFKKLDREYNSCVKQMSNLL